MIQYYAPPEVWPRLIDKNIPKNGCGAGFTAWLIPDKWLGLDFTIPCAIHDEMYALGKTIEDKEAADRIFLNNMLRTVNDRPFLLQPAGRFLAWQYYDKVEKYGAPAFWEGKNKLEELHRAKLITAKGSLNLKKITIV